MKYFRLLLQFILAASLVACTYSASYKVADSDEDNDSGLGGTGIQLSKNEDNDNGLGGTGIVGRITGFGSIFVNGIEIEYDNNTPFTIDGESRVHQQLQIGDIVEVLTIDAGQHTQASVINLRHETVGRVEEVNLKTFSFKVNGQTVVQAFNNSTYPEPGSIVAVAGYRVNKETIIATRVTAATEEQYLLRARNELPFKNKTRNWLIQMYIKDQVRFSNNGSEHVVVLDNEVTLADKAEKIEIIKLNKSADGMLKIKQIINTEKMPTGKQTIKSEKILNQRGMQKGIQGNAVMQWRHVGTESRGVEQNNRPGHNGNR